MASQSKLPSAERERHLSLAELADRWRISPKTLYNRRVSGIAIPPAIKNGGRLVFRVCDVEQHESERLTASTSTTFEKT